MPMENQIDIDDYIQTRGDGLKTLVFLHYFGGSAQSWNWLVDILYTDYRCITINLPGFGETTIDTKPSVEYYAEFVQTILAQSNIGRYNLIGHSMSGKIAVKMATKDHSNSIQQLILLAPSPPTVEHMPEAEKVRMLNHPNENVAVETVKKITVKPLNEDQFSIAVATQLQIVEPVWRWWINEGMKKPLDFDTHKLNGLPVTVITSTDDPCITFKMIQNEVMPNLPADATLITCNGIGHLYPMEDATWLANTLKSIVKDIE